MDTENHRIAVKRVIETYARFRPSHGNIRLDTVFDETHDRYALMQAGWDRGSTPIMFEFLVQQLLYKQNCIPLPWHLPLAQ